MAFVTVARFSVLAEGVGVCVEAGGKKLALFRVGDSCYAIDEICPHRDAPLHEGYVEGLEVECPWHASRFNLETGAHRHPPAKCGVNAYKVQVVGDEVQVEV
jgi:nitrite reductase/ring-hydroxylating ferredoxin subunit